jgi:hypothetical protein
VADVELPDPEELEERRDKAFSRRVALVTAVYAVVLAIASLGGNNAMKEMLLAQQAASNQWSDDQATVIREHLNRGHTLVLEAQLAEPSALTGAEREKLAALTRTFADEEKRMNADKREIEPGARGLEAERDRNQARDPYFDYAEVRLQIRHRVLVGVDPGRLAPDVLVLVLPGRARHGGDDQRPPRGPDPLPARPLTGWTA